MPNPRLVHSLVVAFFYTLAFFAIVLVGHAITTLMLWGPKVIFTEFVIVMGAFAWLTYDPSSALPRGVPKVCVLRDRSEED